MLKRSKKYKNLILNKKNIKFYPTHFKTQCKTAAKSQEF